jgi:hypothetical protein
LTIKQLLTAVPMSSRNNIEGLLMILEISEPAEFLRSTTVSIPIRLPYSHILLSLSSTLPITPVTLVTLNRDTGYSILFQNGASFAACGFASASAYRCPIQARHFPLWEGLMHPRIALYAVVVSLLLAAASSSGSAQSTTSIQPALDPQAIALLQQSVIAMGTTVPSDSTATGTVTTVAGSLTENGTVTILTRGTNQTSEQIQTPHGSTIVYSQGQASNISGSIVTPLSMELTQTSQCPDFPLPLLASALNNSDTSYKYIGLETLNGASVQHVQIWNSYASNPALQDLSGFTLTDIWVDPASYLPQKLSYTQRAAGGSEPSIPVDIYYSNYQNVGGVLYPFSIQKSFNGTPSATITIQAVAFNTGLTNLDFPVE